MTRARDAKAKTSETLPQHDMVLVALARAASWSTKKVPYEDLVLEAWRAFPGAFSLRNHPEYPDASDIHKRLYQTLKPRGYVVSLGNKVFRLTEDGLAAARAIGPGPGQDNSDHAPARLARDEQAFIEQALASRAFSTWKEGKPDVLIDYDARLFFQFSTGTPVRERRIRVAFAEQAIDKAVGLRIDGAGELAALATFLESKFANLVAEP